MALDGGQVEQQHAGDGDHRLVDVAGDREVDKGDVGALAALHDGGQVVATEDRGAQTAAGHDHVGVGDGGDQVGPGVARAGVRGHEIRGAPGAGVDGQVGEPALAQVGDDRAGVGTGADEQHARGRPVAAQQVEADRHHGATRGGQPGEVGHLAGGAQRLLDRLGEEAGCDALLVGLAQRPAQLAGDLALAHDHRVQAGADAEEVLQGRGVLAQGHGHEPGGGAERLAHDVGDLVGGAVGVDVDLDPVAGGQHHGTVDALGPLDHPPSQPGHRRGHRLDRGEAVLGVVDGDQVEGHDRSIEASGGTSIQSGLTRRGPIGQSWSTPRPARDVAYDRSRDSR